MVRFGCSCELQNGTDHQYSPGILPCFFHSRQRSGSSGKVIEVDLFLPRVPQSLLFFSPLQESLLFSTCFSIISYRWKIVEIHNLRVFSHCCLSVAEMELTARLSSYLKDP